MDNIIYLNPIESMQNGKKYIIKHIMSNSIDYIGFQSLSHIDFKTKEIYYNLDSVLMLLNNKPAKILEFK